MNQLDPQCPEDIIQVTLIINGPLGMSPGKIASQSFQACQRLYAAYYAGQGTPEQRRYFEQWAKDGTRTITRIAETPATFERACNELPCVTMIDEGLTEVESNSPTIHATWPMHRFPEPKCLKHKRIPLLSGPAIYDRKGGSDVATGRLVLS